MDNFFSVGFHASHLALLTYLMSFLRFRWRLRVVGLILLAYWTLVFAVVSFWLIPSSIAINNALFLILQRGALVAIVFTISKYRDGRLLYSFLEAELIVLMTINVYRLSFYYFNDLLLSLILFVLISGVALSFFYAKMRKLWLHSMENAKVNWYMYTIRPGLYLLALLLIYDYNQLPIVTQARWLMFLFILSLNLIRIETNRQYFKKIYELSSYALENQALQTFLQGQRENIERFYEKNEAVKILRHDLKHHIHTLYQLLNQKKYEDAKTYLSFIDENVQNSIVWEYCENSLINITLSNFVYRFEEHQIPFKINARVPKHLPISDMDLSVLLSNLLENAFHASLEIRNPEKRLIALNINCLSQSCILNLSNHVNRKIELSEGRPLRKDGSFGIGSLSIQALVDKYQGSIDYTQLKETFKVQVLLNQVH